MNGRNDENLKELFEKFYNSEQTYKAVEDVQKAEQIFREYPAPEPDKELIAGIKTAIAAGLLSRQRGIFRTIAYRAAIIAASVLILAAISINLLDKRGRSEKLVYASIIPRAIWESDNIAIDDADLAVLTGEIEQIEDEVLALQLGESDSNGDSAATELEMELIDADSYFWKG